MGTHIFLQDCGKIYEGLSAANIACLLTANIACLLVANILSLNLSYLLTANTIIVTNDSKGIAENIK